MKKTPHTEHCCSIHGCKYGEDSVCEVKNEILLQSFPCDLCIKDTRSTKKMFDDRQGVTPEEIEQKFSYRIRNMEKQIQELYRLVNQLRCNK